MFNLQKSNKNHPWIIFKPQPHLQTMTQTPVRFQKNLHKIVGVAHTRYYPFTLIVKTPENLWKKVIKNNLRIISKQHAHLQTMI